MENFILIIDIILAVLLIGSILLQKSEGGALGLGVSQDNFMSSRSASSFLTKATTILATLFIITSISLTIMSRDEFSTTSVLEKVEEKKDSSEPEIPKTNKLEAIFKLIKKNFKHKKTPVVLYGGSVNAKNIRNFSSVPNIDGFLIGGASQTPKKFIDIIKNYYK